MIEMWGLEARIINEFKDGNTLADLMDTCPELQASMKLIYWQILYEIG